MKLVFDKFRERTFAANQVDSLFSSLFNILIRQQDHCGRQISLCRQQTRLFQAGRHKINSLTYRIKIKGPRMEPWGSPQESSEGQTCSCWIRQTVTYWRGNFWPILAVDPNNIVFKFIEKNVVVDRIEGFREI